MVQIILWRANILKTTYLALVLLAFQQSVAAADQNRILEVGPQRVIKTVAEAATMAKDGDILEVDAGDYVRDVAVWAANNLTVRAKNGRVRLLAGGASAEAKAIWVVRGGKMTVSGFDFVGASVPDRNGAGIRLEKGTLVVRDCRFLHNENGILTGSDAASTLKIENSEFGYNGFGDGQSHNLYVGGISSLWVSGSYFHHAKVGHLFKSRAAENHVFYNRLTDETAGTASYELEFPSGGIAYVVGNIIQQSATTENPNIISFGAEQMRQSANKLYLVNNTLVDYRPQGGRFLRVAPGTQVVAVNNLLLGKGTLDQAGPGIYQNNFNVDFDEFALAVREDFRLKANSRLIGKTAKVPIIAGVEMRPTAEYQHPRSTRRVSQEFLNPGAMQSSSATTAKTVAP